MKLKILELMNIWRVHMKTTSVTAAILIGAATLLAVRVADAAAIAPGFNTFSLGPNDDGSAGPASLGFTANFFGINYSSVFVNNNGNLTFGDAQSSYTPTGLGASYTGLPIIAPFFADVDTRAAGSGQVTYGTGTYAGHEAFGATYPNVGYYNSHDNKLNDFQVVLTNRSDVAAGDFDIYFNYNQIQFETGDDSGGTDGLGGISAAAGYSNGTGANGTYYQLPGSLVNGALIDGGPNSLTANTNDGVAGQFLFEVRNGAVVVPTVPLPASAPMFGAALLALGAIGYGLKRKKAAAAA